MRLSFNFQSYGTFIIFGTSFHSSQHAGDVVLLQLCMNFVPPNTQIQKFSKVNKGGEHSFIYNKGCLKVSYMYMICRVCALHTNRKSFLHISEGRTDKQILSMFSRCRSLYHCKLNFTPYPVSGRVINTV